MALVIPWKNEGIVRRRRRLGAGAALLACFALAWGWSRATESRAAYRPRPLQPEYADLGVACLALGEVRPELAGLTDPELQVLVELLGRLLQAYQLRDFDSYLALRAGDHEFAARENAVLLDELRDLCRQLAVPEEELGGGWLSVLECFWQAYYEWPPVARFLPEETRVEFHAEGLQGRSVEDWERSFEARCPGRVPTIQHHLMVPHRRGMDQVAADSGPLSWIEIELVFETRAARTGHLIVRFVWDSTARQWFLHRAASTGIASAESERQLIL